MMKSFSVREFGAVGNGEALETRALQSAIDLCSENGGGTVWFPAGRYRTGTLFLRNHVTIHLESGATILGSTEVTDYASAATFRDAVGTDRGQCLIFAKDVHDIAIEGRGTIDGQGAGFRDPGRPMLLRFVNCQRVGVSGVTLRDSGAWVQHYLECDEVELHRITVKSHANGNNDGLNLDGCQRVRVSDCHFSCGDDALTLKCTTARPCRDIVIANCLLQSDCNGLKFGTESIGGFENITITNCSIYDTKLCAITVASVDGAKIENVLITNITARNVGGAIFVRLGSRGYHLPKEIQPRPVGSLKNLTLRNIVATGVDSHGSAIMGLPEHPIENLVLDNVFISSRGGGSGEDELAPVAEGPMHYPQYNHWGNLPAYGLYCRHIKNFAKSNVHFELAGPDARPPLCCDDVAMWEKCP